PICARRLGLPRAVTRSRVPADHAAVPPDAAGRSLGCGPTTAVCGRVVIHLREGRQTSDRRRTHLPLHIRRYARLERVQWVADASDDLAGVERLTGPEDLLSPRHPATLGCGFRLG